MKFIIVIIFTTFLSKDAELIERENIKDSVIYYENKLLNEKSQKSDWQNLFNGKNAEGWHEYGTNKPVRWLVNDGILYTPGKKGDIVTDLEFVNFELEVEWKIEQGGNSGIFYFVQEKSQYPRMYETGPEFQIIDENNYSIELLEKQKTGSCSDVLPPVELASNPPGEWNNTRIIVNNGNVEHWLNGRLILAFSMNSKQWESAIKISKFSKLDYAKVKKGKIGLQDHGVPVYFRKIRILEF